MFRPPVALYSQGMPGSNAAPVLVFVGPSGSGKSTVVRELVRRAAVKLHPSWTDRPPREDELRHGASHRFVDPDEFSRLQQQGRFLEVVQPFGLPYHYGLPPIRKSGRVDAIIVRAPMLVLVDRHFPANLVYQIECDAELARQRLARRDGSNSTLGTRLENFEKEMQLGRTLADRSFSNNAEISRVVDAVLAALGKDFC